MAKSKAREYVWLQCNDCGELNYRIQVKTQGGMPKFTLMKHCPKTRNHQEHKIKRK